MSDETAARRGEHKGEEVRGKAKEGLGKVTGDDRLENQGQTDQASARAKQAGDDLKDAAAKMKDRLSGDDDEKDQ
ncbi:CsbD family protein [Microlunatus sp. Gsoil 973]|uniref:CsbD family protein n=1 Tax=Microlunatus sp. Gsoil 973 TaxID=2672569 RepID=UPI0012B471F3|nr:CsbD family protein [Microlunatus sp. Gsoil 973]QGN32526.1 CsbD family protein [Microlunatus sp. Gsoil 973]